MFESLIDVCPMDTSLLQNRDYTFILARTADDNGVKPPGFAQRWLEAQACVLALAEQCEAFDPDGITIYVAMHCAETICRFQKYSQVTSANLTQIFEENASPYRINLCEVLQAALQDYLDRKARGATKVNGEILIVLVDGEPADRMGIARVIKEATQHLDSEAELGIGFVQIGEDLLAKGFLAALDNNLQSVGAKFDIVSTRLLETIESGSLSEFLLDILRN